MKLESLDISALDETTTDWERGEPSHPSNPVFKSLQEKMSPRTPIEGTISTIISSTWYVKVTDNPLDIVDDLSRAESIEAIGVVNTNGRAVGIIVREKILKEVSRPYGRDLLSRKTVTDILAESPQFSWTENIFTVAEQVNQTDRTVLYYLVRDEEAQFFGIFSSWDLVIFLSKLTREDIGLAQKIQRGLIKEMYHHQDRYYEFAYSSLMAKGIGGDFIGIKQVSSHRYVGSICDVAGKGIAASLISSTIAGMLEAFDNRKKLSDFIILLNQFMVRTFGSEKYVTGIFFEFSPTLNEITIFDLGHSHIAFYRKEKLAPLPPPVTNPPLGIMENFKPTPYKILLQPKDILLLFSDGLVEQVSSHGSTYTYMRIKPFLNNLGSNSLPACIVAFWEDFHTFRGHAPQVDDVTVFLLRYVSSS